MVNGYRVNFLLPMGNINNKLVGRAIHFIKYSALRQQASIITLRTTEKMNEVHEMHSGRKT